LAGDEEDKLYQLPSLGYWRHAKHFDEHGLARRVGLKAADIRAIEQGTRRARMSTIKRMAEAMYLDPADLLSAPPVPLALAAAPPTPPIVLVETDPLGRVVVATDKRWEEHIVADHEEMDRHYSAAALVIRDPEEIRHDVDRRHRESYYRRGVLPAPYTRLYAKVSVEFGIEGYLGWELVGIVVTAYPLPKPKRGEELKWQR
jgi:transcriptional regulator with XRE-family HTH domain